MTRTEKTIRELQERASRQLDTWLSLDDVRALRKAAITLHGWYEAECNGDIQRHETTGKPERVWTDRNWNRHAYPCPDREKGAEKRIAEICERLGLHFYLQTDPRGGTLYVSRKPIPSNDYNRATFIA